MMQKPYAQVIVNNTKANTIYKLQNLFFKRTFFISMSLDLWYNILQDTKE